MSVKVFSAKFRMVSSSGTFVTSAVTLYERKKNIIINLKALDLFSKLKNIGDSTVVSRHRFQIFVWPFCQSLRLNFNILKKCRRKIECLIFETLLIRKKRPKLHTKSDFIRAKQYFLFEQSPAIISSFIFLLSTHTPFLYRYNKIYVNFSAFDKGIPNKQIKPKAFERHF